MNPICYYPDWEGGIYKDKHIFDKEGWCIICGEPTDSALKKLEDEKERLLTK